MANAKVLNITITVAVAAIMVVAVLAAIIVSAKGDDSTTATASKPTTTKTTTAVDNTMYKDGMYTAKGTYNSPGGNETITVTLTLASNIITDSTVVGNGDPGVSGSYQAKFIANYKSMVVGKKLLAYI